MRLRVGIGLGSRHGTLIPSTTGQTRVLVLALGESGMMGQSYDWPLLADDHVALDGSVSVLNDSRAWTWPIEPADYPGDAIVDAALSDGTGYPGVGFALRFCGLLRSAFVTRGDSRLDVGLVMAAKGGVGTTAWEPGGSLYNAALAKATAALAYPGAVLGCILLDHGINDALFEPANVSLWATRWRAILASLKASLGTPSAPVFATRQFVTAPATTMPVDPAIWDALLTSQSTLSDVATIVQKPDGPRDAMDLHLATSANLALADLCFAASDDGASVLTAPRRTPYAAPPELSPIDGACWHWWDYTQGVGSGAWVDRIGGVSAAAPSAPQMPTVEASGLRFSRAALQCLVASVPTFAGDSFVAGYGLRIAANYPYQCPLGFGLSSATNQWRGFYCEQKRLNFAQSATGTIQQAYPEVNGGQRKTALIGTSYAIVVRRHAGATKLWVNGLRANLADTWSVDATQHDRIALGAVVVGASSVQDYLDGWISHAFVGPGTASDDTCKGLCNWLTTRRP